MNKDRFRYRAWHKLNKQYYYDAEQAYDYLLGNPPILENNFGELLQNDDYILEQCTGLKDKNGKFIYEGDIVAYNLREGFTDEKFNPRYSVRWSDNYMRFDLMREGKIENIYLEPFFNKDLEVIGNIHER